MTDLQALLKQIVLNPKEDSLRLMYADELDAVGEHDRAEFVRVQCELGKLHEPPVGFKGCVHCDRNSDYGDGECCYHELRRREQELLNAFSGIRDGDKSYSNKAWWFLQTGLKLGHTLWPWDCVDWSRGFISSVTCTAEDFFKHADALVWNVGMTDECKRCGGYGQIETTVNVPVFGPEREWKRCPECKGGKAFPRPMPDTAQPIERVTLTTQVEGSTNKVYIWIKCGDGYWYCGDWNGVAFDLIEPNIETMNYPMLSTD